MLLKNKVLIVFERRVELLKKKDGFSEANTYGKCETNYNISFDNVIN